MTTFDATYASLQEASASLFTVKQEDTNTKGSFSVEVPIEIPAAKLLSKEDMSMVPDHGMCGWGTCHNIHRG